MTSKDLDVEDSQARPRPAWRSGPARPLRFHRNLSTTRISSGLDSTAAIRAPGLLCHENSQPALWLQHEHVVLLCQEIGEA